MSVGVLVTKQYLLCKTGNILAFNRSYVVSKQ